VTSLYGKLIEAGYSGLSRWSSYKAWTYYRELLANQYLPEPELRRLQWRRFSRILRHAFDHVPFYAAKFKEAGIGPEEIDSPDAVSKIPLTTRKELMEASPHTVIARGFSPGTLVSVETSGTTEARPFRVFMDRDCLNRKYALLLRNYSYLGWRFGRRIMTLWNSAHEDYRPMRERSILKAIVYGLLHRKRLLPPFHKDSRLTDAQGLNYYERLRSFRPHLLEGDAFVLYRIGRFFEERNLVPQGIRAISSAAGPTTSSIREDLERMFSTRVYNNYGPHEMEGIACECSEQRGLHQSLDSYWIEFIRDGTPARTGELSELVLTDLDNLAMPLIRYRIGDYIRAGSYPCACGRTFPLMRDVEGRTSDALTSRQGVWTESRFQDFFGRFNLKNQFQVIEKNRAQIEARIVRAKDRNGVVLERIKTELEDLLGRDRVITVEWVDTISCEPSGKFRLVKSMASGTVNPIP
jgi:phenylacetate-CoA ligase